MKQIPKDKINRAIELFRENYSTRQIAQQLNISKGAAANIFKDNKENLPVNLGGRPRKMNPELVNHLKLNLKRGVHRTAVDATKEANTISPVPVSRQTVSRELVEAGMKFKKEAKAASPQATTQEEPDQVYQHVWGMGISRVEASHLQR